MDVQVNAFFVLVILAEAERVVQANGVPPVQIGLDDDALIAAYPGLLDKVLYQLAANALPLMRQAHGDTYHPADTGRLTYECTCTYDGSLFFGDNK